MKKHTPQPPVDMDALKAQLLEALADCHSPITIASSDAQREEALEELKKLELVTDKRADGVLEHKKNPDAMELHPHPPMDCYATGLANLALGLTAYQLPAGDRHSEGGWGSPRHRWSDIEANLPRAREQLQNRPQDHIAAPIWRRE